MNWIPISTTLYAVRLKEGHVGQVIAVTSNSQEYVVHHDNRIKTWSNLEGSDDVRVYNEWEYAWEVAGKAKEPTP